MGAMNKFAYEAGRVDARRQYGYDRYDDRDYYYDPDDEGPPDQIMYPEVPLEDRRAMYADHLKQVLQQPARSRGSVMGATGLAGGWFGGNLGAVAGALGSGSPKSMLLGAGLGGALGAGLGAYGGHKLHQAGAKERANLTALLSGGDPAALDSHMLSTVDDMRAGRDMRSFRDAELMHLGRTSLRTNGGGQ